MGGDRQTERQAGQQSGCDRPYLVGGSNRVAVTVEVCVALIMSQLSTSLHLLSHLPYLDSHIWKGRWWPGIRQAGQAGLACGRVDAYRA